MEKMEIPECLVFDILSKLPIKSILRFRAVCKSWYAILSNPEFLYTDLFTVDSDDQLLYKYNHYHQRCGYFSLISFNNPSHISPTKKLPPVNGTADSVGYSSITIAGCCNGIVLLKDGLKMCLWNPATEETKLLPELTLFRYVFDRLHYVGFCFDAETSDFKVILIFCPTKAHQRDFVYSLRSDSWKAVEPQSPQCDCYQNKYGIALNSSSGMCHWFGSYLVGTMYREAILSFDANREIFKMTTIPYSCRDGHFKRVCGRGFFMLKEYVAMICKEWKRGMKTYEIWAMVEVGVKESWIKVMNIEPTLPFDKVLRFWENGKIFLQTHEVSEDRTGEEVVVIFDPFTGKISPFLKQRNLPSFQLATNYKKSQVQLREQVEHHDTEKLIIKRPRTN